MSYFLSQGSGSNSASEQTVLRFKPASRNIDRSRTNLPFFSCHSNVATRLSIGVEKLSSTFSLVPKVAFCKNVVPMMIQSTDFHLVSRAWGSIPAVARPIQGPLFLRSVVNS